MWSTHVDPSILAEYKAKQLLKSQTHPRLPLSIWNYAPACQYSKDKWDDVTTLCRGLIIDTETNEVVGRSFRKFWNEGEKLYTPTDTFTVWEKMDGSLGILFNYKGQWIITSRGSFSSDQALRAQKMLETKYDLSRLDVDTSYVFEIIYPENRIVIDYGTEEALYFLAAFKKDGTEIFPPPVDQMKAAGFPICRSYPEYTDYAQLHALDWANHEGFVIRFSTGERMKIKFENYLDLHRMATSLSTNTVYDWYCEKKPLAEILEISPDEFHGWVKGQWVSLQSNYDATLTSLKEVVEASATLNQKEFAKAIAEHPQRGILFSLRANKDVFAAICKEIKPTADEKLEWGPQARAATTVATEAAEATPIPAPFVKVKPTITLMIGISGSGKSTYAKAQLVTKPTTVIVSRDKIREMIFGYEPEEMTRYYDAPKLGQKEELVTQVQQAQIEAAIATGYDVIVDDTNLNQKVIRGFFSRFPEAQFNYHVCECEVAEAVRRSESRARKVSADVIGQQYSKLIGLLPYLDRIFAEQTAVEPIAQDASGDKPPAVIVDLDGTLALHTGRSPYDWTRVEEDVLNEPVYAAMKARQDAGDTIILCSGRSEEARAGTERWLASYGIKYEALLMRASKDQRPDYIVKEEIWRELVKSYFIRFMLDDRNCVVNHARRLGFTVFQVAPGNF